MKKKIYLAIPFSGMEELSYKAANETAAELIKQGNIVFSPITHSYPLWKTERMAHTYDVWLEQDRAFVEWCDEVYLVIPNGDSTIVEKSKGVRMELNWAKELNKPIKHIIYDSNDNSVEEINLKEMINAINKGGIVII